MNKNKSGFTIIEVVLVLAIAGMIFMIVFLAVPAMQRNQRDTRRKADLNRAIAAVSQYKSSHRGRLPTDWGKFVKEYIVTESSDEFVDPSGVQEKQSGETTYVFENTKDSKPTVKNFEEGKNIIYYKVGAKCDVGNHDLKLNQGDRTVALQIKLENAGWHCLDD